MEEKLYRYIYKITCTAGSFKDKFYFGQHTTSNLDDGYNGSGRMLVKYYKKYPNDYIKEIISFHNTQEELNQAEYDIISPWLNNPMCLNLKEGGGSTGKLSIKTKELISKKTKGENNPNYGTHWSKERREKMMPVIERLKISNKGSVPPNKGKHHTEETKKKISNIIKVLSTSEEYRKKISEGLKVWYLYNEHPMLGKHHTEEAKRKNSESHKGKPAPNRGKPMKEESKLKMIQSLKQKYINGEINCPWKGKQLPEDMRKKISEKINGKIKVNNGIKNKYILPEELDYYISLGWNKGWILFNKRDKSKICLMWVHKGNTNKRIKEEDIPIYLENGYIRGRC